MSKKLYKRTVNVAITFWQPSPSNRPTDEILKNLKNGYLESCGYPKNCYMETEALPGCDTQSTLTEVPAKLLEGK